MDTALPQPVTELAKVGAASRQSVGDTDLAQAHILVASELDFGGAADAAPTIAVSVREDVRRDLSPGSNSGDELRTQLPSTGQAVTPAPDVWLDQDQRASLDADGTIIGHSMPNDSPLAHSADRVGTAASSLPAGQSTGPVLRSVAAITDAGLTAFPFEAQLESRDGSVRIVDTTAGGTGNANLTQIRDPQTPETVFNARHGADRLWDGFTGAGYLDMGQNAGDAVAFDVDVATVGTYTITIRYANGGTADRPLAMSVGGVELARLAFAPTAAWDAWSEVSATVQLQAGYNTIKLAIPSDVRIFTGPNLDRVEVTAVDPGNPDVEPGPREVIRIDFQDGAAPKVAGYLVDSFQGFGSRGNGESYGWVTEASAIDADGTTATPINGSQYPAIAINQRTGTDILPDDDTLPDGQFGVNYGAYDPRLTEYVHFDLGNYPSRAAWQIALENGWYEVTVAVGEPGGPNDSTNKLYVEGALASDFTSTSAYKTELVTTLAHVQDGFLTLSAQGGTITEMSYLEIRALPDLTPGDGREAPQDYAAFSNPVAVSEKAEVPLDPAGGGAVTGIDPTSDISIGLQVVEGRGGVLRESLKDGSIRLFETLTGLEVAYNANTSAGSDTIAISPSSDLKPYTSYTLVIDGAQDRGLNGDASAPTREFQKFSTTFTTGADPVTEPRKVIFADTVEVTSNPMLGETYTSIEMSPDKSFVYVTSITGTITRWGVDQDTGAFIPGTKEVFAPGGDFDVPQSADNPRRGIIGLAFDPEDAGTIWITDNYPIPLEGHSPSVPDFSGRISKVTLGEGGSLANATVETFATGLPRSDGDHVTNSLEFRLNPNVGQPGEPRFLLYLTQGSNTAMGDADSQWGNRPERLLNAAILEIDRTKTPPVGGIDLSTEPLPTGTNTFRFGEGDVTKRSDDGGGDGDLKNGPIPITSGEWQGNNLVFAENGTATVQNAAGEVLKAFYDPYAEDAPVRIFAEGVRNAYDLVWHSNGYLYVPTNGSAAGGSVPDDPDTPAIERGSNFGIQNDYLFRVKEGGYYGHPNPLRDDFILNGGNPTSGADPNQVGNYPVGTLPDPDYDLAGAHSLGISRSPNGAIEYTSSAFGPSLQGALIFTQYSTGNNLRAVTLNADGTVAEDFVLRNVNNNPITYVDPLDLIEGADGRLYMLTLDRTTAKSQIVRLEATPGAVVPDTTADAGNDLALLVVDKSDPKAVVFQVDGLDTDIQTITVSFDGGPAQAVTLGEGSRFVSDLSARTGTVSAVLAVADASGNTATKMAAVALSGGSTGPVVIDATAFTLLDLDSGSIIRRADIASTRETNTLYDANRDGMNDGYDGVGYLDMNGGAENKASFAYTAAEAGSHSLVFRVASTTERAFSVATGGQAVTVTGTNTGSFSSWKDVAVTLNLVAGSNTITLRQTGAAGPNIDGVTVTSLVTPPPADLTADEGGDLRLTVVDASNPGAVVFAVAGRDADIELTTFSLDGGETTQPVTLANDRFTVDLTGRTGAMTATLGVQDEADNHASASASFTLATSKADIRVQSLDAAFFDNRLHFNWIDNPKAMSSTARDFKESATVRISNDGTGPLKVSQATVSGPFKLADAASLQGLTLAPGQSADVTVNFDRTAYKSGTSSVSGVFDGALTLNTNDADTPVTKIDLSGFWQARDEGGWEPNVNEVWDVFGFGNRIEGLTLNGGGEKSTLSFYDVYLPADDTEVLSAYWKLADGATSAKITQIVALHGIHAETTRLHAPGSAASSVAVGTHTNLENQSFLPLNSSGGFVTSTFGNGTIPDAWAGNEIFGISVGGLSTDPNLNPTGSGSPTQAQLNSRYPGMGYTVRNGDVYDAAGTLVPDGYTVRMFQALDDNGVAIPSVFLGIMDYTGINYDYNDNMFVIEGVKPVYSGAVLTISGLDAAAADDRLVFSRIDTPANATQVVRNQATITLTNDGIGAMTIKGLTAQGEFQVVSGPAAGSTLAAGASATVTVAYVGKDLSDDNAAVLHKGSLFVSTSAGDRSIALGGLAQVQSEGGEEPTVAQIVEAFGYTTNVAQGELADGARVETVGDEVLLPYLQRLDGAKPIEVLQIAAYLSPGVGRLSMHGLTSSKATQLTAQDESEYQTVLPHGLLAGPGAQAGFARATINSDAAFGLKVTVDGRPTYTAWSDPNANIADKSLGLPATSGGHYVRFFKALDAQGQVIAGTFIGVQDYPGGANFDYNDSMFVIRNVKGHALTATEDANGDGVLDVLKTDADRDGIVDFFDLVTSVPQTPYPGPNAPGLAAGGTLTVDASNYDAGGQGVSYNDQAGLQGATDGGRAGSSVEQNVAGDISFIASGEWLEYTVNVAQAGTYDLDLLLSTAGGSGRSAKVDFYRSGETTAYATTGSIANPLTSSWTDFQPRSANGIALEAGEQVVRVTFAGGNQNFRSLTLEAATSVAATLTAGADWSVLRTEPIDPQHPDLGRLLADLDAGRSGLNVFAQDLRTVAGQTYDLSLDISSWPRAIATTNGVEVVWNGRVVASLRPGESTGEFDVTVIGTGGSDRLVLREAGGLNGGHDELVLTTGLAGVDHGEFDTLGLVARKAGSSASHERSAWAEDAGFHSASSLASLETIGSENPLL